MSGTVPWSSEIVVVG